MILKKIPPKNEKIPKLKAYPYITHLYSRLIVGVFADRRAETKFLQESGGISGGEAIPGLLDTPWLVQVDLTSLSL